MPYTVTDSFKQEAVKLEQDQIIELYALDLASIEGYMSFNSSTKQIISRDRDGLFPSTRIKVGDVLEVRGTNYNNKSVTVNTITARILTVDESLTDEGLGVPILTTLTNYSYYANNDFDIVGYKLEAGELVNTEQIYTRSRTKRENVQTSLESDSRPKMRLSIANVDRIIESIIQNRSYLRGCFVYNILGFAKFFPSGGTYQYIGSSPDYNSFLSERFTMDGASCNEAIATFDCRYKYSFRDIQIPRRRLDLYYCAWAEKYGGSECGVSGGTLTTYPTCDGTLVNCRERGNSKRFGAFPAIPKSMVLIR